MTKAKKTIDELMSRQREINTSLGQLDAALQERELNDEEKASRASLLAEYESNKPSARQRSAPSSSSR